MTTQWMLSLIFGQAGLILFALTILFYLNHRRERSLKAMQSVLRIQAQQTVEDHPLKSVLFSALGEKKAREIIVSLQAKESTSLKQMLEIISLSQTRQYPSIMKKWRQTVVAYRDCLQQMLSVACNQKDVSIADTQADPSAFHFLKEVFLAYALQHNIKLGGKSDLSVAEMQQIYQSIQGKHNSFAEDQDWLETTSTQGNHFTDGAGVNNQISSEIAEQKSFQITGITSDNTTQSEFSATDIGSVSPASAAMTSDIDIETSQSMTDTNVLINDDSDVAGDQSTIVEKSTNQDESTITVDMADSIDDALGHKMDTAEPASTVKSEPTTTANVIDDDFDAILSSALSRSKVEMVQSTVQQQI